MSRRRKRDKRASRPAPIVIVRWSVDQHGLVKIELAARVEVTR